MYGAVHVVATSTAPSSSTPLRSARGVARQVCWTWPPGRSKPVFKQRLKVLPEAWREGFEIVGMDGFAGFKTAAIGELPDAVEVVGSFLAVKFAGDALDEVRRCIL